MKNIFALFTLLITTAIYSQQPFDCNDGNFYQVISGVLKIYNPITGSYSDGLHTYSSYNAGGYNEIDNFLYAIKNSDKHLLRIGKDQVIDLGALTPSGTTSFGGGYAADVDKNGNLWIFQNGNKKSFHKVTNLNQYNGSSSPVFEVIEADYASPSNCADITFINGSIYGGSRGRLYKWDLSTGSPKFTSKIVTNLPNNTFGAAYSDAANRLYLSDNSGGLYLINDYESASPYAQLLNLTETTNSNDGFKCASGLSPLDKDQDGTLDSMDSDSDGDGILNTLECNGNNPYGDDDGDLMYNYLDNDVSGNGDNVVQDAYDRDRDGNPDFLDIDSDNDGIYDIVEVGLGDKDTNFDGIYNNLDNSYSDLDNDGLADAFDSDQNGSLPTLLDTDNDLILNCYDIDSDNDGIVDIIEGQLANTYIQLSYIDLDNDGMDDAFDIDYNGSPNGYINTDGTDLYDHLDTDSDNDGILDQIEAYDTDGDGVAETNPSGFDTDQDGLDDNFDLRKSNLDPENGGQTPSSFPVPEICDQYNYLGEFTSDGTPLYLEEQDVVSQETLDMISDALPEGYPVPDFNPHYISSGYETDVILKEQADVWVTFVDEGAGYKNTLGYYTYDINDPIETIPSPNDITIIFPNVSATGSGGGLEVGDKVKIGSFSPDTGIGWVLLANGWDDGCVGTGHWQLHSNPDFNPETDESLRYHNVLLDDPENERIILGFEDIRRDYSFCDQDFNDAIFYITANPYSAIKTDNYVGIDTATDVTSANNGGLESNGDLASLIAKRNFDRTKKNTFLNTKKRQKRFTPGLKSYRSSRGEDLSVYFPKTGMLGTETTYVSSPDDLIGITNAKEVFSVDYYDQNKRVAAALATSTTGSIYDHSKTICDRLNGSELLDVRTVSISNHTIVSTKIKRATGEVEYALTFSIKHGETENEIYSLWNISNYPEGDYKNFQVWGGSITQIATIAKHILSSFTAIKPMRSHKVAHRIPTVFVEKGVYKNGELVLQLINKSNSSHLTFNGNIRATENASEENLIKTVNLSGAYKEQVVIKSGYLFDIGFSISADKSSQLDALYLADGPWGIDYLEQGAIVESYDITKHEAKTTNNAYHIERNAKVKGKVKETLNVFRNILAGELTLDISSYDALEFEMSNDTDIEVILVTEDLKDWKNRLRYLIKASDQKTAYNLSFSDFKNSEGTFNPFTNIKSVVFSIQGDYTNFKTFQIEVASLSFTNKKTDEMIEEIAIETIVEDMLQIETSSLINYPNPFLHNTTIQIPGNNKNIIISVYDSTGKKVRQEKKNILNNTFIFEAKNSRPGLYHYIIRNELNKIYTGRLIIK